MDDEGASSGPRGGMRQKKTAKATYLEPDQANATVSEVFPKQCRVKVDHTDRGYPPEFLCSYRRANVVGQAGSESRERTPVAVGDRVLVSRSSPDSGVVEGVCERRNRLMRRAPGREDEKLQHVLAANVDVVVIVASVIAPEFSPGLVDRFLVGAQISAIEPILCITKMDLWSPALERPRPWQMYCDLGIKVIELSIRTGEGIQKIKDQVMGQSVVFCGRSGAGKTSLLTALLGSTAGRVGEVSEATGKGKHTTTSAILLGGPENSQWIDTPGIREFGLAGVKVEDLE
jgi:ribosome biogenesis GTPase